MADAWIVETLRTPIDPHRGRLAAIRLAHVVAGVLERSRVASDAVDDVHVGCTSGVDQDSGKVAAMAALPAGLPQRVPGVTVNRVMGRAPWAIRKPEKGLPRGHAELTDTAIGWRCINLRMDASPRPSRWERRQRTSLTRPASLGRRRIALRSNRAAAERDGRFADELPAVDVAVRRAPPLRVAEDGAPRAEATLEALGRLSAAFKPSGGAIALRHPLGCSGARMLAMLRRERPRRGGRYRLATMCIGVRQGDAVVVENPRAVP